MAVQKEKCCLMELSRPNTCLHDRQGNLPRILLIVEAAALLPSQNTGLAGSLVVALVAG